MLLYLGKAEKNCQSQKNFVIIILWFASPGSGSKTNPEILVESKNSEALPNIKTLFVVHKMQLHSEKYNNFK